MKTVTLICLLTFSLAIAAQAVRPKTAAEPAKTAAEPAKTAAEAAKTPAEPGKVASEPVKIQLKNKSSFTMEPNARNPFWPIGWKPVAKLSGKGGDQAGDIPVSAFLVSTITMDEGAHFAIVNGKIMQEGQQFGLQLGNQTYQIVLKRIEDGRVILGRQDQEIVVPLRRK